MGMKHFATAHFYAGVILAVFQFATPAQADDTKAGVDATAGLQQALQAHVNDKGRVDYAALKANRRGLDAYVRSLARVNADVFKRRADSEQLAFWINAYNACTLQLLIDHYPITERKRIDRKQPHNSIMQIDGAWKKFHFDIMGTKRTLDEIEHEIIRKQFKEPRIHMALVCGAVSCPYLRNEVYRGPDLDRQLDEQTATFLSLPENLRIESGRNRVVVSRIFEWFAEDWTDLQRFIATHAPERMRNYLSNQKIKLVYADYNWSLNSQ